MRPLVACPAPANPEAHTAAMLAWAVRQHLLHVEAADFLSAANDPSSVPLLSPLLAG